MLSHSDIPKVNSARDFEKKSKFDRPYFCNGSIYQRSEQLVINCCPYPVGQKKIDELWSTNKKVGTLSHFNPP